MNWGFPVTLRAKKGLEDIQKNMHENELQLIDTQTKTIWYFQSIFIFQHLWKHL